MAHICICRYPLIIIDGRDGKNIEYLAFPTEVIKTTDLNIPEIELISTEGLDGVKRDYVAVMWQQLPDHSNFKKYDVVGHIVTAGCHPSEAAQESDGSLYCESKDIYLVLHPADEWILQHVIELKPGKAVG